MLALKYPLFNSSPGINNVLLYRWDKLCLKQKMLTRVTYVEHRACKILLQTQKLEGYLGETKTSVKSKRLHPTEVVLSQKEMTFASLYHSASYESPDANVNDPMKV